MSNSGSANKVKARGANGLVIALAVVVLVAVAFLAGRHYFGRFETDTAGNGASSAQQATADAIGGPFTLVDQDGQTVTDADFRGKYMLVYFGYTYCPDICPTALTRNSEALEMLGDKADAIVPIFISVDPKRDTTELLKDYVEFFHPRLVALTGTPEQVAAAAKAYRVYFAKVEEDDGDPDTYLMDHTAITYLMGPDGKYLRHFGHNVSAERMVEQLKEIL